MSTLQALLVATIGAFFVVVGVLLLTNLKIRDWFARWWFPMDETNTDKKNSKKYVQFLNGPLMILVGFLLLVTALGVFLF
mgnify:CR=1